jgi:GNAT superfamily N-acetyltransferase
MSVIIRKAQKEDIPVIHSLVRELAIYEKGEKEFVVTVAEYERDFEDQLFEALLAEVEGQVVGMVLFYMTYSTWKGRMLYLEDFVVRSTHRRMGIGERLFDAFLETARQKGCSMVKWQVLDWNKPALNFYRKHKAIIEKEWWNGKIIFKK